MKILFLASDTYSPLVVLQCLQHLNPDVYLISSDPLSCAKFSRYCRRYFFCDLKDFLDCNIELVRRINLYCALYKIDMILPAGIESTLFLAKVKKDIKNASIFPVPSLKVIKRLNNKWEFIKILKKNSLSFPTSILIKSRAQLQRISIIYPVVIKPLEAHSGLGIKVAYTLEEVHTYLSSRNPYISFPFLLQEFVEGIDFGVSFLAKNGEILAWTSQQFSTCGGIQLFQDIALLDTIKKIAFTTYYTGVANIDLRFDIKNHRMSILECNPRFFGSMYASKLAGINFPYLGILVANDDSLISHRFFQEISYMSTKELFSHVRDRVFLNNFFASLNYSNFPKIFFDPLPYLYLFFSGRIYRVQKFFRSALRYLFCYL